MRTEAEATDRTRRIEMQLDAERALLGGNLAALRARLLPAWLFGPDAGGDDGAAAGPEDEAWLAEAAGLRARADALLDRIDSAARDGLAPAAEAAGHRAEVLAALADDLRAAMARGLETLPDEARAAVIAARASAYEAWANAAGSGAGLLRDRPLLAGAALAAAGVALAAVLPRTRAEDRILGVARGLVGAEARRIVRGASPVAGVMVTLMAEAVAAEIERRRPAPAGDGAEGRQGDDDPLSAPES